MNNLRAINRSKLRHSNLKYLPYSCGFWNDYSSRVFIHD